MLPSARTILRKHSLTKKAIYAAAGYGGLGVLNRRDASVTELREGYLLALASYPGGDFEGEEEEYEELGEGFEEARGVFAADHTDWLRGELISRAEGRVVGLSANRIFHMADLLAYSSPEELVDEFDNEDADTSDMINELRRAKPLRHLVRERPAPPNLLHLETVSIEGPHRRKGLGLDVLSTVLRVAAEAHGCGHAIMLPSPLGERRETPAEKLVFEAGREKLTAYYMRLGFKRTRPGSHYLHKSLASE
jgi:GNAT superfamily N-acetyltransferase